VTDKAISATVPLLSASHRRLIRRRLLSQCSAPSPGTMKKKKPKVTPKKSPAKSPSISPSKSPPTANLFPFEKDPDLEVPSDVLDAQIGESADTVAQQLRIDADLAFERNAEPSSKKEIDASSSDPSTSSMKVIDSLMSDPSPLSKTEIDPSKSDPSYPLTAAPLEPNSAGPTAIRPGSVKDGEANTCVELGMEDSLLTVNEVDKAKPSTPQPEKESSVLSVDGSVIMNGLDARNVHSDQKEHLQKKEANIGMTPALPRLGPREENKQQKEPTGRKTRRGRSKNKQQWKVVEPNTEVNKTNPAQPTKVVEAHTEAVHTEIVLHSSLGNQKDQTPGETSSTPYYLRPVRHRSVSGASRSTNSEVQPDSSDVESSDTELEE
ncbi:hypothetical protein IGI04_013933, partial [Brassica rapa subsp. trilocularis]